MLTLPKRQSKEELKDWLFNDLMSQIEPDLTSANRAKTVAMLSTLSPEALKEKLSSYEEAFHEFMRRWPGYVEQMVEEVNRETKKFQQSILQKESEEMAEIERKLNSNPNR
ncbi:hypothetical protein H6770_05430 [Candidatus Peribacteria bacterium]|nr:hypothetical protein [Candidatus Peribacteria bacterium]